VGESTAERDDGEDSKSVRAAALSLLAVCLIFYIYISPSNGALPDLVVWRFVVISGFIILFFPFLFSFS